MFKLGLFGNWKTDKKEITIDENYEIKNSEGLFYPLEKGNQVFIYSFNDRSFRLLNYDGRKVEIKAKKFPFVFATFRNYKKRLELWKIVESPHIVILPMYKGFVFWRKKEYPAFAYVIEKPGKYVIAEFNFAKDKIVKAERSLIFELKEDKNV